MDEKEKEALRDETNDAIFEAAMKYGLSEKEIDFVMLYLETYNVRNAYLKVFGGRSHIRAVANGKLMLNRPHIAKFIKKAKEIMQINYDINPSKYLEFLLKAANADITDFLSFSEEEVEVRNKEGELVLDLDTGEPLKKKISKIRLKDSSECDCTLISRVSQGREGIKIELIDKLKCWDRLRDYFGWEKETRSGDITGSNIIEAINNSAKTAWKEKDIDKDLEETLK